MRKISEFRGIIEPLLKNAKDLTLRKEVSELLDQAEYLEKKTMGIGGAVNRSGARVKPGRGDKKSKDDQ